jgi:hypothetical protein
LTTLSNILVISTGVPDQAHFSLSTSIGNCEGLDYDDNCTTYTAALGDHFGNPVPDGTAVNFTTEGGVIGASCVTGSLPPPGATPLEQTTNSQVGPGSGTCSVVLRSGQPRWPDGYQTVLAYALGEENFTDVNGNNVYNTGDTFSDKSPDIFRDDNENGIWTAGEPCIGPNLNGSCSTPGDGIYNGVLRLPRAATAQTHYVSAQIKQIFSGSDATVTISPTTLTCPAGTTREVQVRITDRLGNVMPAGSFVEFSTIFGVATTSVLPANLTVPNVVLAVGQTLIVPVYTVTIGCPATGGNGSFIVKVTTPVTKTITTASFPVN